MLIKYLCQLFPNIPLNKYISTYSGESLWSNGGSTRPSSTLISTLSAAVVQAGWHTTADDRILLEPANKHAAMGLLPDTQNCGLRIRRECWEHFPRHWLQMKPRVSDIGMHHGTWITHVLWCMPGSLTRGGGESIRAIPGACATRNFAHLIRGSFLMGIPVIKVNVMESELQKE